MSEKNKITGLMLDKIVSMRNDQTVNYTYKDIKESLKLEFNCEISINGIRLAYLKNANREPKSINNAGAKTASIVKPVKQINTASINEPVLIKKEIKPDNGLRALTVSDEEKQSLLDELNNL